MFWRATSPELWRIGQQDSGLVMVPTNQMLNPAGKRLAVANRVVDIAFSQRAGILAALLPSGIKFFSADGTSLRSIPLPLASFMGLAFTPDGQRVAASLAPSNGDHSVALIAPLNRTEAPISISFPRGSVPAGLAFDQDGSNMYVALNRSNLVARVDMGLQQVVQEVQVGVAPIGVAISPQGDKLFVANWGGRQAQSGENAANSSGTPVLIDEHGIANSGTVSVIELPAFRVVREIDVGMHPSSVQISPDGKLAAVANANSDSVTFVDVGALKIIDTVKIPSFPEGYAGSSPTSLVFNSSGSRLYVTCAGNNSLAVLEPLMAPPAYYSHRPSGRARLDGNLRYRLRGFVPVDWYPIAIAIRSGSNDQDTVYVANAKGIGSGTNSANNFTVVNARGSINILSGSDLKAFSTSEVALRNDPFRGTVFPPDSPKDLGTLGIDHTFLIIKENRTYDQILGDLDRGNGDPTLTLYGADTTPNQHELAKQFVTLDNYYTSGVVSADGHHWLAQASVTDYLERGFWSWARSYPYTGNDPLAFASTGFIWDRVLGSGRSVRIFGEFTQYLPGPSPSWTAYYADAFMPQRKLPTASTASISAMSPIVETEYPAFTLNVPDLIRARVFVEKFSGFVASNNLPNFIVLLLPADHTTGLTPNYPVPEAMVADNDLALGQIVEAITTSPFWPHTAIFVTEDDAQDGVDHVDGHRTLCLVISPYARRDVVDSIQYNQTSVLRTIEELMGLAPMNKFDAAALPMRSVFTSKPDFRPYLAVPNKIPLNMLNPPVAAITNVMERQAAIDSSKMDFSRPDAAPEGILNKILWHHAKGWEVLYPKVWRGRGVDDDDDWQE
jgi:DNA-binding beta-propeller fold protein YncE